jgi:hypothetical protein
MTVYKGMLLFDIAEPSINGWENQLGYRGYIEVWKRGDWEIVIEPDEDEDEGYINVYLQNPKTGNVNLIGGGYGNEADKFAKEYMRKN